MMETHPCSQGGFDQAEDAVLRSTDSTHPPVKRPPSVGAREQTARGARELMTHTANMTAGF
jgi:hypothetical protein